MSQKQALTYPIHPYKKTKCVSVNFAAHCSKFMMKSKEK